MESTIYLFFNGTCHEAMSHHTETLGGEVEFVFRNGDAADFESGMPGRDQYEDAVEPGVRHGLGCASRDVQCNSGFRASISPASLVAFNRFYDTLSKDAMPPDKTLWLKRFTMFTDRYSTPWMLNFEGAKLAN